ncbi:MAG: hypothetical protein IPL79_00400 [Myxococcales bacterium]|nr:hypothetical protein [Myxococcales bacterium]
MDSGRYVLFVLPLLCAAVAVAFAPVVLGGGSWLSLDYHAHVVPPALAVARDVQQGHWPFWWQGVGLGVPLLEAARPDALYPTTWLATTTRAHDVIVLLHLVYFALGTALWTRQRGASDLASALWGCASAIAIPWLTLGLAGALGAWAHVPWLMMMAGPGYGDQVISPKFGRFGRIAMAALLWAAVGLAGQIAFFAVFAALWLVFGFVTRRCDLRGAALSVVIGGLLAAPQWMVAARVVPLAELAAWVGELVVLAPLLVVALLTLPRHAAMLVFVGGAVAGAMALHLLAGPSVDGALCLALAAWVAASCAVWSLEALVPWRVFRVRVPMRPLGLGALAVTWLLVFAHARQVPTILRETIAMRPALWPVGLAPTRGGERVLRGQTMFDDEAPPDAAFRRALHSLYAAMGTQLGAHNVQAGARYDAALAEAIGHAAGSMGQFIDRMGLAYAIVPSSAVIASGLEALAQYDGWSLVRTATARPRALVTSNVEVMSAADVWPAIFPVGLARRPISFVALDAATVASGSATARDAGPSVRVGACNITHERAAAVTQRCQHEAAGYAVLLDAWAPGWSATVNGKPALVARADGVARAVAVPAGESFIEWTYQPTRWHVAVAMWWLGVAAWLACLAIAGGQWVRRRRDRLASP